MTRGDYMNILRSITADECIGAVKSANISRLGDLLYEFNHNLNGYVLKTTDGKDFTQPYIHIYIKLLLGFDTNYDIAIISFHDPLDNDINLD